MDIYLPKPDVRASSLLLSDDDLLDSVTTALAVMKVAHEADGEHEKPFARHPLVQMWKHDLPFMWNVAVTYGEELFNRIHLRELANRATEGDAKLLEDVRAALKDMSWHLDLATTDTYSLEKPPWWGNSAVFDGYRSALFLKDPNYYKDFYFSWNVGTPYRPGI